MKTLTVKELAGYFDHTLLKAFVTDEDFKKLCEGVPEGFTCACGRSHQLPPRSDNY